MAEKILKYTMTIYIARKPLTKIFTLTFGCFVFLLSSALTYNETLPLEKDSEQIKGSCIFESIQELSFNPENRDRLFIPIDSEETWSAINSQNTTSNLSIKTTYVSSFFNSAYPYFPLAYTGFGVDHMNINLVNLALTGLIVGDEIGVFDGIYCVGSAVIQEKNLIENSLSIPASANESTDTKPNGYIDGHKVTLKTYRAGIIYLLYFQTVNNSTDTFERGSSMFALIDFNRSEEQTIPEGSENIKIYPNPFATNLRIEISISQGQQLNCEIFDITGKLIKTLYEGPSEGQQLLIWDGKDYLNNEVATGVYFCRLNQSTYKILFYK
jgi:hypothetical protein